MNKLSNFIPCKAIVCDDKDSPWFNKAIKSLIQEKNDTLKKMLQKWSKLRCQIFNSNAFEIGAVSVAPIF